MHKRARLPRFLFVPLLLGACGVGTVPGAHPRDDGKADALSDGPPTPCEERAAQANSSQQPAFTPTTVRWSCSDVRGTDADERGQEYCEYFAIVELDGRPSTVIGRQGTPKALALSAAEIEALDRKGTDEVGRCVFTSWHLDAAGPVPACADPAQCPRVAGQPVTTAGFRMQNGINSGGAARGLLASCLSAVADPTIADPYLRGCQAYSTTTGGAVFLKADPTICAAAVLLAGCGCGIPGVAATAEAIADALVPPQPEAEGQGDRVTVRGFPLGGWAGLGRLPAGCDYVETGFEADGSRSNTIVSCTLTAADVLRGAGDLEGVCRERYGDGVVVHVPLLAPAIVCAPPGPTGCERLPWLPETWS